MYKCMHRVLIYFMYNKFFNINRNIYFSNNILLLIKESDFGNPILFSFFIYLY